MREDRTDPLRAEGIYVSGVDPRMRSLSTSTTYRTVVEDKGGACIDRRRTSVGRRINVLTRVQLQCLELGFSVREP